MAFLVEHRALSSGHSGTLNAENADTTTRSRSRPSTMKLFRRTSSNNNSAERSPPQSRKSSVTEPERRSSLTAIPARLRRRRTKSSAGGQSEECQSATQLGQLLCSLPSEILVQIICNLSLFDIYSLRLTSRWFESLLNLNASAISRYALSQVLPRHTYLHACSLYPPPSPCPDLRYLLQMLHRQHRVDKVIYSTLSYIQFTIYMMNSRSLNPTSSWNPERRQTLAEILQRPAWTAYHFLETYRDIIVSKHDENQHGKESGRFWDCTVCEKKGKDLIISYKETEVIPAFHFLELLTQHYRAATRAPANLGPKISRWSRTTLTDEDLNIFVFLGGIEELHKINHMQGSYNKRIEIIDGFATKVRTAIDINHANARTAGPSVQTSLSSSLIKHGGAEGGAGEAERRELRETKTILPINVSNHNQTTKHVNRSDLTKSLAPPYALLTKDHLDRLPSLDEFLLPIWQNRIERDIFHGGNTNELEAPFEWIETVLYYGSADPVVSVQQSQPQSQAEENGSTVVVVGNDNNIYNSPLPPASTPAPPPVLQAQSLHYPIRVYGSAPT